MSWVRHITRHSLWWPLWWRVGRSIWDRDCEHCISALWRSMERAERRGEL